MRDLDTREVRVLKKFKENLNMNAIAKEILNELLIEFEKSKANQAAQRENKRQEIKKQREFISQQKKKDKKYTFTGERIKIGKVERIKKPKEIDAIRIVEKIIYDDWMRCYGK